MPQDRRGVDFVGWSTLSNTTRGVRLSKRQRKARSASSSSGAEYSKQAKWVPEGIVIECLSRLLRRSSSRSVSASVDVVSESPRMSRMGMSIFSASNAASPEKARWRSTAHPVGERKAGGARVSESVSLASAVLRTACYTSFARHDDLSSVGISESQRACNSGAVVQRYPPGPKLEWVGPPGAPS